jgi:hypothetical protein
MQKRNSLDCLFRKDVRTLADKMDKVNRKLHLLTEKQWGKALKQGSNDRSASIGAGFDKHQIL